MSATQLAAFLGAVVVAGGLVALASVMVVAQGRRTWHGADKGRAPTWVASGACCVFALIVLCVGGAIADPSVPAVPKVNGGCPAGTYNLYGDDPSVGATPHCIPNGQVGPG